jgi:hypothetical protein
MLLAVLPLLSGCAVTESEKPLSPPASAVPDKRLEGLWRADGKGESGYLYISYGVKATGSVMAFGKDTGSGMGSAQYDFFVTRTAKHNYVNLSHGVFRDPDALFGSPEDPEAYIFAEYHFSWTGQLVYSLVTGDAFVKAVEAGKLRGKVFYDDQKRPINALLKDSPKRILDFIESSKPADVFGAPEKLTWTGHP